MKNRVVASLFHRVAFTLLAAAALLPGFTPKATAQPSGYALDFNPASNNYVRLNLTAPPASNYTLAAWVKLRTGGVNLNRMAVLSGTNCGNTVEFMIHATTANSTDAQYVELGRCGAYNGTLSRGTVPTNVWTHVAVTVSSNKLVSYFINGSPAGSWSTAGNVSLGNTVLLGANSGGRQFDGQLDSFQLWNRELSAAEVQTNVMQQLTGNESGLSAWYPFNEGSGGTTTNAASAGGGSIGTLTNAPRWVIPDTGFALDFRPASNNYVEVNLTAPPATNYTLTAWVKLRTGGDYSVTRMAVLSGTTCPGSIEFLIHAWDDTPGSPQYLELGRCGVFNGSPTATNANSVPLNAWTHVAVTLSSNKLVNYYINGNPAGSWDGTGKDFSFTSTVQLGANNGFRAFDGQLADFQFWSRELSPAEILANLTQPLGGSESGLYAWYPFNEGGGSTTTNKAIAAGGSTGTLVNNPLWVIAPVASTLPVTDLAATSATLNGTVNPRGAAATAWFEWGTTTNYGNFTPTNSLAATYVALNLSHTISGLTEGNTYHYRLAVGNGLAVSYGADISFSPQTFQTVPIAGLPGVSGSSVSWGDYDNDGRLDFLLTGSPGVSQLWRNTGSGFADVTATAFPAGAPPGVQNSSVSWGDYDNDGRLDFLLTGLGITSQLWRNTGSGFSNVTASVAPNLPGFFRSSVAWGDYDNDGRLDFLATGSTNLGATDTSQLWRSTGSGFSNVTASVAPDLPGVSYSSVAWGDYDNDGRLDFLLTGNAGASYSRLYRNTGSGFTNVSASVAPAFAFAAGVYYSSVAWGDYDNDGRLDLLRTGLGSTGVPVAQIWRNTGTGLSNVTTTVAPGLPGSYFSSVAWGDYDNDGRLDFLLTGTTNGSSSGRISQLWRNTGSGFSNVTAIVAPGLPGVYRSSVAWGDFDNDGRLDFLLTGTPDGGVTSVSQLWRNSTPVTNAPPTAPTGLALTATTNAVMLSWNSAVDDLTPATGLTYNVRAGSTPGGIDLLASHVNATNGFRRVPAMGNAMLRHTLPLTGLTNGQIVYWSVQAVDTAFAGGPFATETSVVTIPTLTITPSNSTNAIVSWSPPTWGWRLQETPSLAPEAWTNSASGELNPATVSGTNSAKFFRLTRP